MTSEQPKRAQNNAVNFTADPSTNNGRVISDRNASRGEPVAWVPNSPDGGWGWMVVLGSLLIHVFADGFVYSFGTIIVELLEQFNEGKALTSWIVSTLIGLTLGAGPLASAVTHKFGCRFTTMLGAVIASVGCALSFFATSIVFLMVTVGLIMGLGFGLMYCPAIIIVTVYFEEKRAFATGIAVCGAGIGTFIFAPLSTYLIELYTWRGAFLIYSGILLNCAVCGALFRPLDFLPIYEDDYDDQTTDADDYVKYGKFERSDGGYMDSPLVSSTAGGLDKISESEEESGGSVELAGLLVHIERSELNNGDLVPIDGQGGSIPGVDQLVSAQQNGKFRSATHLHAPSPPKVVRTLSHGGANTEGLGVAHKIRQYHPRIRGISESAGYLGLKDAFYTGSRSTLNQRERTRSDMYRSITSVHSSVQAPLHSISVTKSFDGEGRLGEGSVPPVDHKKSCWKSVAGGYEEFRKIVKEMFNPALLTDPLFVIFVISNFLTSMGFNAPLVFMPDRAVEEFKIPKDQASLTLSAFGVANTIGRLAIGFVADRQFPCKYGKDAESNRLWIYNISLTLSGFCTLLCFWCRDLTSMMIYMATFGFTLSSYVCLTSVILVDLLGMEKLTNAFGLLLLAQGIASFMGPPVAGLLVDATGSYDNAFYFSGASLALSGIILYFVPCIKRRLEAKHGIRKKSSAVQLRKNMSKDQELRALNSNDQ